MRRACATGALLVVGLIVTGCASGPSKGATDPPPATQVRHGAPTTFPLASASAATTTPRALTGQPSLGLAEGDAKAGWSRAAAEQFALEAAHVLTDVRPGLSGTTAIGSLASSTMTAAMRTYLAQDMDDQHTMGFERHFDTGMDMWIRSLPEGPADAPRRVTVELAANIAASVNPTGGPGPFQFWYRMRLVVVREHGEWRLEAVSDGPSGPTSTTNLTVAQRRAFLLGTGWRRIPPA